MTRSPLPAPRSGGASTGRRADPPGLARVVLDSVDIGIVACDLAGRLVLVNDAAARLLGLGPDVLLPLQGPLPLFEPDGTTPLTGERTPLRRLLSGEPLDDDDLVTVVQPGGARRRVRCSGRLLHGPDGVVTGAVLVLADVTAARVAEQRLLTAHRALSRAAEALATSEEQFRAAFENGPGPMCSLDEEHRVLRANPAVQRLLGLPAGQLTGRTLTSLVAPGDRERLAVALAAAAAGGLAVEPVEVRVERADGSLLWCEAAVGSGLVGAVSLVQLADVDDRKQREAHLQRLAAHDPLTGLANRTTLLSLLEERLAVGQDSRPVTVLFLDLDGFKDVNDSRGHAAGDAVLVEVAERLRRAVRPTDVVARLGGDEFVVVCLAADDVTQTAEVLVSRVTEVLAVPYALVGGPLSVGATVGVAHAVPGQSASLVLSQADGAMYARKAPSTRSAPHAQVRLAELVDRAVEQDRLVVAYQPVVDLVTRQVQGAEALVRMLDLSGKVVPPDAFIPLAEASGAIQGIGAWVLRQACRDTAAWKRQVGDGSFAVGVNLSPRQLDDPRLLDVLDEALADSGLDPGALVLELTERLLTPDTSQVQAQLRAVRERGVHLAADDFGTGYCSLRYLADLPLDLIKIDRSWTAHLGEDTALGRLATGVARLAGASGLVTVVEGVETERERLAAIDHGLSLAQGYLFSRPVPAEQFTALLHASTVGVP